VVVERLLRTREGALPSCSGRFIAFPLAVELRH
jgi:hypothetical protein